MFSSLISRLFSSDDNEPNYFFFEDTRKGEVDDAKIKQATAHVKQLPPVNTIQITEYHSRLFYDYLFGKNESSESIDELSQFVNGKIDELLKHPLDLIKSLPPLPTSLNKIIEQSNNDNFDIDELMHILEQEPMVAAKVIERANSAHYNKSGKEISDLRAAFMLLGTQGLLEGVVIGFVNKLTPKNSLYFNHYGDKIWKHSVTTAEFAKELVANSDCHDDASQAYLVGLLSNLGNMIIFQLLVDAFAYVHPDSHPSSLSFKGLLYQYSKRLTYYIAKSWKFPSGILNALAKQVSLNSPAMLNAYFQQHPITSYVYEANILAEVSLMIKTNEIKPAELDELKAVFHSKEAQNMFELLLQPEEGLLVESAY